MDHEQPLSELGLRYRRNTLAILFILTVLLVVPDVQVGKLSVLEVSIEGGTPYAEFWVWMIIFILLGYQLCMFLAYAVPDAQKWVADMKEERRHIWFEMTEFWPARWIRDTQGTELHKSLNNDGRFEYRILNIAKNSQISGMTVPTHFVRSHVMAFHRMLGIEFGIPVGWFVLGVVYIISSAIFGFDVRDWLRL